MRAPHRLPVIVLGALLTVASAGTAVTAVEQAPTDTTPVSAVCAGPVTATAGQLTTHMVSAADPDGMIVSAGISAYVGNPLPGSITTAGVNPALVSVDALVPAGTYTVTIEFFNNDAPTPQSAACDLVIDVVSAPRANLPIAATCGGPLTHTAGQLTSSMVSASDPDGMIVSAGISAYVGNPLPGSITVAGVNPALVTVDAFVPLGTYVVTIEFFNNDAPIPESAACDLVINVVSSASVS